MQIEPQNISKSKEEYFLNPLSELDFFLWSLCIFSETFFLATNKMWNFSTFLTMGLAKAQKCIKIEIFYSNDPPLKK